jgi:chromate transporter
VSEFLGTNGLALFLHFSAMSMLAIGGAIAVAPEMHRYLVEQQHWLDDTQFSAAIALAQAAPGPNVLFVPLLGHAIAGMPGALVALVGVMLPSTTLAMAASRWSAQRRETRAVRAFVAGMAPVTIGLLLSAGTVLARPHGTRPTAWALVALTTALSARTRINPVWLIAMGAGVGALGWI